MNKYRVMKKGGKSKRFPDLNKDGKITMADILQGRGVKRQAYGGKVEMGMGGKTEYGIGGAIMAGVNAIKNKEGLRGIGNVVKAYATPGSGVAQGAKLAGGLLAGSKNPGLAGLGKGAGLASNFLPGSGGPKGGLGALGSLAGGAGATGGAAGLLGSLAGGGGPMAALGALPGLLGGQSAQYGMKVKKMEEGGESDPPKADFLLRGDVDDMNELQQSRSDRGSAFGTASTDVFMPTGNIPSMPEGSMMREMEDMEDMQPPEDMQEIESRGPRLLRKDPERGLVGGMKDIPEASKEDSSFSGIYFSPGTSNIRAYVPDGGEGERTFGARGFEMEDRIPYGFREEGRPVYAKPEVFEMMREEGVGARGAAAEDYLAELYKKNPELFSKKQDTRNIIQQKVLEEAKTRKPGVPGFYIPTSPLKASF